MNNILIFSPTPSHPQNAGNRIRIYSLAKYLQNNGNKIIFVYYTQEGLEKEQQLMMEKEWDKLIVINKNTHYRSSYLDHFAIDDWYEKDLGLEIQKIIINNKIDIVLCTYIFQSKILEFIPDRIMKIIDTHDKFSNRHIMLQDANLKADFFYTIESEESIGLNRADIIIAIQDKEARFFKTISDKRVEVVGHIDNIKFLENESTITTSDKINIGFVGSANTINIESLKLFLENFIVLNKLYTKQVNIKIVGEVCSKINIKHESVEYMGFVDSLEEFYKDIDLIINPLIIGTGLKIKTVEALSFGKPVLSTIIGFEGISSKSQFHNCKDIESLIDKLIIILKDKAQCLEEMKQDSKKIFTNIVNTNNSNIIDIFKKKETNNTLIITHINFWERDLGSRNRLYDMLVYLKENLNVTVIYINKRRKNDNEKIESLGLSSNVIFIEDLEISNEISTHELNLFIKQHSVLKSFKNEEHYRKIATFIKNYKFNKVIIEYIHLSYFLPLFEDVECYLDSMDILYQRNEIFKRNNEKHWIDITKEEEFSLFKEYKYILSIQKNEYNFLLENNVDTILVPYSFKINATKNNESSKSIVFIGGDTIANKDSINWFINNIWDTFINSGYTLDIYGTVSYTIKDNPKKNIYVKGKIEDLDSLYTSNTAIAINPVTLGGGLKIKNVEAIASGIPLLTTTQGAFGIEDGINNAFLVANTIDEWKDKLIALTISKDLKDKLSKNAIEYTKYNFQRDVCYEELTNLLLNDKKAYCDNR